MNETHLMPKMLILQQRESDNYCSLVAHNSFKIQSIRLKCVICVIKWNVKKSLQIMSTTYFTEYFFSTYFRQIKIHRKIPQAIKQLFATHKQFNDKYNTFLLESVW